MGFEPGRCNGAGDGVCCECVRMVVCVGVLVLDCRAAGPRAPGPSVWGPDLRAFFDGL